MANEIIKIMDYITSNPIVQGYFIASAVVGLLILAGVIAVFVYIIRQMKKMDDGWRR